MGFPPLNQRHRWSRFGVERFRAGSEHGWGCQAVRKRPMATVLAAAAVCLLAVSCASVRPSARGDCQPDFRFGRDTFAFNNEVIELNPGRKDLYALHCFVMSCSANRFWKFARFDPGLPKLSDEEYARLIYRIAHQPFYRPPYLRSQRIVVPGYANVHEFSRDQEAAFKENLGSKYISCWSYRNWRMSLGVTHDHQARTAQQIVEQLDRGMCDQVHIVDWPWMNHSALIYACRDFSDRVEFTAYDPNNQDAPLVITYHKAERQFTMPKVAYYGGGEISIHRMYYSWWR